MSGAIPVNLVHLDPPHRRADRITREHDRLVGLIEATYRCTRRDAEAALNRIFVLGGMTSTPWSAPFVFLEIVLRDAMHVGPRLEDVMRSIETPAVIAGMDRYARMRAGGEISS